MSTVVYVYENTEVKKTGRTAERKLNSGKMDVLYEITPVQGFDGSWKKWIRDVDLFIVNTGDDDGKQS
jgi:hypothetical protein